MNREQGLILKGGTVRTLDAAGTVCEAIAVRGGRIVGLGDAGQLRQLFSPAVDEIDVLGRTIVPGLIDGHAHLDREGLKTLLPTLAGAGSVEAIQARIRRLVQASRPGEWVVTMPVGDPPHYRGLPDALDEGRYPNRWDLDRVAPDNPVYIRAIWGYWRHELPLVSIANSKALELAGVDRDTVSPWSKIVIDRNGSGEPTGVFYEYTPIPTVEFTLMSVIPPFSKADRLRALPKGMAAYAATGTTGVLESHGVAEEVVDVYSELHANGDMALRAELMWSPSWPPTGTPADFLRSSRAARLRGRGEGDGVLRLAGCFIEPHVAEGDRLRAASMPYTGWAGFSSDAGVNPDHVFDLLVTAAKEDVRVGVITSEMLGLLERVDRKVPLQDKRWVMGHISFLTRDELRTIKRLGLVLTTHTNRYIYKQGEALTRDRAGGGEDLVCLRTILDEGIPVAFGTDNVPTSLFHPVWHAVSRQARDSGRVLGPGQRISREEAMRVATRGGAFATFSEDRRGTLEVGKDADMAVLTADPWTVPEQELPEIASDLTIVGGRIAHLAPDAPWKVLPDGKDQVPSDSGDRSGLPGV